LLSRSLMQGPIQFDSQSNARGRKKKALGRSVRTQPFKICLAASAGRSLINTLTCSHLYRRLVICCCCTHSFFNLAGHGKESLLNVTGVLRRGLEEWNAKAVSEFLITMHVSHFAEKRLCLTQIAQVTSTM